MKKAVLSLFLFLFVINIQAQSIHKTWQIMTISGNALPEGELIYLQFTKEGILNVFSPKGNTTSEYILSDDRKILEIKELERIERWEIKLLSEKELIILGPDDNKDELVLAETDIDPATIVMEEPIEEAIFEEPIELPNEEIYEEPIPEYSIESDFKPSKKDAKAIQGYWVAKTFNGEIIPAEVNLIMGFDKSGKLLVYINGKPDDWGENTTYKLNGQKLEISGKSGEELWGIRAIGKKELILLDKGVGEIRLERTQKPKS